MLGSSSVAAQLAVSQEGLSSMSESVKLYVTDLCIKLVSIFISSHTLLTEKPTLCKALNVLFHIPHKQFDKFC
jgi:hypothetical protein